ncbi:potassium/proton antiporter [Crenobacter cavernae]|uniref:Potassium/proton antiporter n=1 Tax=Crenobacter cavernae TaxID=2290923 RepID=A0ABY0FEV6_9NEIS|nr:potassium/proton antiporter [Crenobacter cavernae]RXZ43586.1 potassium/proton antiporter [Crenobacter cavernae]
MELINQSILVAALILFISLLVSSFASRLGAPLLLVFLALGMLAGEDGPGGIAFDNYPLSYLIGTVALVVILFDGGLRTRIDSFRVGLKPALSLATLGVLVTALITGSFAAWLLDLSWLEGLLIGAIVGSTDAAAVFSLLSGSGLKLNRRVGAVLEIESGSNDPMAVFLTLALIGLIASGRSVPDASLLMAFVQQMGVGALAGWLGGRAMVWMFRRLSLEGALLSLFGLAAALLLFALASVAGGSGFLAIYLAGLLLGNARIGGLSTLLRVQDGYAWLAQVVMFLVLGLLVTPHKLVPLAPAALAISLVLMLVARPVAVWLGLLPFSMQKREKFYIGWVGLRGAVPIILGIFPLMAGLPNGTIYFNVAFFVVLMSLVFQGWSLVPLAGRLGLKLPATPPPARRVKVEAGADTAFEAASFRVEAESVAERTTLAELALPEAAHLAAVFRGGERLAAGEAGALAEGDWLYLVGPDEALAEASALFSGRAEREAKRFYGVFTVDATLTAGELAHAYGVTLAPEYAALPLSDYCERLGQAPLVPGDIVPFGRLTLVVAETDGNRVSQLGIRFAPDGARPA